MTCIRGCLAEYRKYLLTMVILVLPEYIAILVFWIYMLRSSIWLLLIASYAYTVTYLHLKAWIISQNCTVCIDLYAYVSNFTCTQCTHWMWVLNDFVGAYKCITVLMKYVVYDFYLYYSHCTIGRRFLQIWYSIIIMPAAAACCTDAMWIIIIMTLLLRGT